MESSLDQSSCARNYQLIDFSIFSHSICLLSASIDEWVAGKKISLTTLSLVIIVATATNNRTP
jgi:Iap family predicted aminopeptidase